MSDCQFAVVDFVHEKSVGVVPETWIEKQDGALYCYYPRNNVVYRVKKKELPDKDHWSTYKIRVLCYAAKYAKAMKRAEKAEETSNIDSSGTESEEVIDKRPKKRIDYGENDDYDKENSQPSSKRKKNMLCSKSGNAKNTNLRRSSFQGNSPSPNFLLPMPPPYSTDHAKSTAAPNNQLDDQPSFEQRTIPRANEFRSSELVGESLRVLASQDHCSPIANLTDPFLTPFERDDSLSSFVQNLDSLKELGPPRASSPVSTSQCGNHKTFQTRVLMKLDTIIENQKDILAHMRRQGMATGGTSDIVLEDVLPKPMETIQEMNAFCAKLEELAFSKALGNHLATQSGHTCGDTVRRIMAKVGTNKLWSLFSLKGRKTKTSFKSLNLYNVIVKACMKCHQKINEKQIEDLIADTLKHAPGKPGGSRYQVYKMQDRQNETNLVQES